MKKRFTGLLAALLAALCLLPAWALADEPEEKTGELASILEPYAAPDETEDELFSAYVRQRFYALGGVSPMSSRSSARSCLDARERAVYDILLKSIRTAAEKGGNTRFTVPLETIFTKLSWSAGELKARELPASGGEEEAREAAARLCESEYQLDGEAVRSALLADCPYELYWYDRTAGAAAGFQAEYKFTVMSGEWNGTLDFSGSEIIFDFPVAGRYQDKSSAEPSLAVMESVGGVGKAAVIAAGILSKYQNEDDYHRLLGYWSEIRDLAAYDPSSAGAAYGDPWQLVYVFDGDDSTKASCEGYSTAFQYLCDLTRFSGEVGCYTVEGMMSDRSGMAPHMWNIVRINGRNYLADVTNSDKGRAGADGGLFLAGTSRLDTSTPPGYVFSLPGGAFLTYYYDEDQLGLPDGDSLALEETGYEPGALIMEAAQQEP